METKNIQQIVYNLFDLLGHEIRLLLNVRVIDLTVNTFILFIQNYKSLCTCIYCHSGTLNHTLSLNN